MNRSNTNKYITDWCADRLTRDQLKFLRSRPATLSFDGIFFSHGSPRSDTDRITIATPDERIREWCIGVDEHTVVCGHTHAQFDRQVGNLTVVNPGSVGNGFGEAGSYWALFDSGNVQLRFTRYDTSAAAQRILASGFPRAERMAREVRAPDPIEHSVR